jgi:hypothetical protein
MLRTTFSGDVSYPRIRLIFQLRRCGVRESAMGFKSNHPLFRPLKLILLADGRFPV